MLVVIVFAPIFCFVLFCLCLVASLHFSPIFFLLLEASSLNVAHHAEHA